MAAIDRHVLYWRHCGNKLLRKYHNLCNMSPSFTVEIYRRASWNCCLNLPSWRWRHQDPLKRQCVPQCHIPQEGDVSRGYESLTSSWVQCSDISAYRTVGLECLKNCRSSAYLNSFCRTVGLEHLKNCRAPAQLNSSCRTVGLECLKNSRSSA